MQVWITIQQEICGWILLTHWNTCQSLDDIGVNVQISSSVISIVKMQWNSQISCMFYPLTEIISYMVIVKGNICLFMLSLICTLVIWYVLYNHWPRDRGENNCHLYSSTAFWDLVTWQQHRKGVRHSVSLMQTAVTAQRFLKTFPLKFPPLMNKSIINIDGSASSITIRTPWSQQ